MYAFATTDEIEPTTVTQALKDSKWRQAMSDEFNALVKNGTWALVSPSPHHNLVGCKWIFRIKRNFDGSVDRYKARLVAKGFHQRPGVDFHDTFSPVVKPTTVRIVLSIAVSHGWELRQLDINNAFLQGHLYEDVYMAQPQGFIDGDKPNYVCKLRKAIYGLKQAPRAWYNELRSFLIQFGFKNSMADTSLFVYNDDTHILYLIVYVDDLIITGDKPLKINEIITLLAKQFSLKDLGNLAYFLGIEVVPNDQGLILSQRRYILELLNRANMTAAKSVLTPLPTTAPDIAFMVNRLSQYMHYPTTDHWTCVKQLLRYLAGTVNEGLQLYHHSSTSIHAFSDADWAGNKDDFSSTGLHGGLVEGMDCDDMEPSLSVEITAVVCGVTSPSKGFKSCVQFGFWDARGCGMVSDGSRVMLAAVVDSKAALNGVGRRCEERTPAVAKHHHPEEPLVNPRPCPCFDSKVAVNGVGRRCEERTPAVAKHHHQSLVEP
ncbi:hypothetical protein KPL70_023573 [Citrus sinensis]|nr:hypothetical protein KPL70_023573 [Citrus sinensis]